MEEHQFAKGATAGIRAPRFRHNGSSAHAPGMGDRPWLPLVLMLFAATALLCPVPFAQACPGDLTGSFSVDGLDLLVMLNAWGRCNTDHDDFSDPCDADLNGDGEVNGVDLLILLNNWGPCTEAFSCNGNCAGQAPGGCWCDASCIGQGDCCSDACEECGHCADPGSCLGNCGDQAPSGCWCDGLCEFFDDCCDDACAVCHQCSWQHCVGHCGGRSPIGCWCDEWCHLAGDCCKDACNTCGYCP